jgi:FMN reductase
MNRVATGHKLLIVGIGGTFRPGSSTEKALAFSLRAASMAGADTALLGGEFLNALPIFNPQIGEGTAEQRRLVDTVRRADGIILATPGYHGSLSGVIKNALDTLELTRNDPAPYFQGRPIGTIVTADGGQAGGTTLMALRGIIHAMRGWPTPLGAALNASVPLFADDGQCSDRRDAWQLEMVAEQIMDFATRRGPA